MAEAAERSALQVEQPAESGRWRRRVEELRASQRIQVALVYAALLLDNVLLTVVVPILPDYLQRTDNADAAAAAAVAATAAVADVDRLGTKLPSAPPSRPALFLVHADAPPNCSHSAAGDVHLYSLVPHGAVPVVPSGAADNAAVSSGGEETSLLSESARVGLLLSSKALVQLLCNPLAGMLTSRVGARLPQLVGSASLLAAALAFAFGQRFASLLMARSLQGVASSCIGVSGMSLVAELFSDAAARSRVMGAVLGAAATGVLVGYPLGGSLYQVSGGKAAPFLLLSVLLALLTVLQMVCLGQKQVQSEKKTSTRWHHLLSDSRILLTAGAILLSTSAMAILEPCLPIWLMDTIKPQKWQLGLVFFPDSLGYLLGTNCFGVIAYYLGPWKVALVAMILVGISGILIPAATGMAQLVLPHFGLGLGIGMVDAALVPFLANLVDTYYAAHYGSVYSLEQTAVSLAYFLGPFIGGELVQSIGFPWLMRIVGLLNLLYCPFIIILICRKNQESIKHILVAPCKWIMDYQSNVSCRSGSIGYKQFSDSESE